MSGTVLENPVVDDGDPTPASPGGPDISKLQDHTPQYVRTSRAVAGQVFVVGLIYLYFCLRPIWHTDVWGHLAYGRTIWQAMALPATEPLMPLSAGMRFIDTAWLSQIIGFATVSKLGLGGLQGLYAICVTTCTALLVTRCYQITRNAWFSLFGLLVFLMIGWGHLQIMRPQMAGLACFVVLLATLTRRRPHTVDWVLIPSLFAAWANLHGSFLTGLLLLGCFAFGRAIDMYLRTRSVRHALCDDQFRRLFLQLELAAAAVLVNPYGLEIYAETLRISSNSNLTELTEWFPLNVRDDQGAMFALVAAGLAILYRFSPRRVPSWECLALVLLGWATMWSSRMIVWWAPVAGYLVAIHGHAVWRVWRRLPLIPEPPVLAGKWSVVSVGLIWIFFAYSPLGMRLLHGKSPKLERTVSAETPLTAVNYLTEHPPAGQVFNTYEWGDYLQWAGPEGMKVFVNSHAHLVPREVWKAYIQISEMQSGWEETLDKYGVNTIVIDNQFREPLVKKLKDNDKWKLALEQDGQAIFVRKSPI